MFDLAAVVSTTEMAERAGVPCRTVLNRAVFRSRIAGAAVVALRERGGLLSPTVYQRCRAGGDRAGRTAQETEPCGRRRGIVGALAGRQGDLRKSRSAPASASVRRAGAA